MNEINANLRPQATVHTLEIKVSETDLLARFDTYWNEVKDLLSPQIVKAAKKGGFREVKRDRVVRAAGGPSEFFKPVLVDIVQEWLKNQDRQALLVNSVELKNDNLTILASVYLEPEVRWKKTPPGVDNEPFILKIPKQPENIAAKMLAAELADAQENAAILVPVPDGTPAALEHVVVLDVESTIDNQKWASGSFTNNKWLLRKELFHIPEMLEAILGMKNGEEKNIEVILNERFTDDVRGKTVNIKLHVGQVYQRELPTLDDDLAKTHGFNDFDAYQKSLQDKISKTIVDSRDKLIQTNLMSQIMSPELVEIDPVPFNWMASKAKEIYGQSRQLVRTEEELVTHFKGQYLLSQEPVTDKPSLLTFFAEKLAQQLIHDLILRSWGKKKGVAGDTTLEGMPAYVASVKQELLSTATIEEYNIELPEG